MAAERKDHTVFEQREELMVSPTGESNPVSRKTHFLKPNSDSIIHDKSSELKNVTVSTNFDVGRWLVDVHFCGWGCPEHVWKAWVNRLRPKHESTWRKAGIYDAILSSTCYSIEKDDDLILALAEKWCPETNTFIFPWGEATISLEDMIVLGGFSVLGESVINPLDVEKNVMLKECLTDMPENLSLNELLYQMCEETEFEFEHESFLVLWLSRFVFPGPTDSIRQCVYPIADCLARGVKIALAPAVLASIYRDLSLLKTSITDASSNLDSVNEEINVFLVTVTAPFQLVQVWIWERFIKLRPEPNKIQLEAPRFAKWDKIYTVKTDDHHHHIKLVLDSTPSSFQWRPYNSGLHVYTDSERSMLVAGLCLDEETVSYVRCIRVSELVGLDCIEQYLPHRTAMQFGIDQDLPGHVARSNESVEIAFNNYTRPIDDMTLYILAKLYESGISITYRSSSWKHLRFEDKDDDADNEEKETPQQKKRLKAATEEASVKPIVNDDDDESGLNVEIRVSGGCEKSEGEVGIESDESPLIQRETQVSPDVEIFVESSVGKESESGQIQESASCMKAQWSYQGDLKDIPPPPGFPHKYKSPVEAEKSCDDAAVVQDEMLTVIGNEQDDESKSSPIVPSCLFDGGVDVQDELMVEGYKDEVNDGPSSDADSIDEIDILEIELTNMIEKLEKVFNGHKLAKIITLQPCYLAERRVNPACDMDTTAIQSEILISEKSRVAIIDPAVLNDISGWARLISDPASQSLVQMEQKLFDCDACCTPGFEPRECDVSLLETRKALKLGHDASIQKERGQLAVGKTATCQKSKKTTTLPMSDGCARCSINGWEWHKWSLNATPSERARVRGGSQYVDTWYVSSGVINASQQSNNKSLAAQTNKVKLQNLLTAAEGAHRLRIQRSKIHDWGLVALEPIEAEDFVIEYFGEIISTEMSDIRERYYETLGIGSSYLFKLDDGYVVDATKRGGVARFINHSCEPNCYTKVVSVEGQKKIFIYAKRCISVGEEITYNYWFPLEAEKIPCNCGSKRCCGSLN